MPNYGDVALNLPANWDRTVYESQEFLLTTVGHVNGVADAYLAEDPDKEHQFRWADPKDQHNRDLMLSYQRGYQFVTKDKWTKNPMLWDFDAENRVTFGGLVLMARPKERFIADQKRRDEVNLRARKDVERDVEEIPEGLLATEAIGAARRRPGRPRREHAAP